jgi:hypothetical protein
LEWRDACPDVVNFWPQLNWQGYFFSVLIDETDAFFVCVEPDVGETGEFEGDEGRLGPGAFSSSNGGMWLRSSNAVKAGVIGETDSWVL